MYRGGIVGLIKEDTRTLDYSSSRVYKGIVSMKKYSDSLPLAS